MEENESIHPDYLKGFNEGYLLKKYLPELADKLLQAESHSSRSNGFKDGVTEYVHELEKAKYPAWLREDRYSDLGNEPDRSKERDRDDLEPEK